MHERVRTPPHKTNRTHATIKKHTPTTHTHTTSINHAQKQDVVEPLESVSVTLAPTDKKDVSEFGDIADVADTLAKKVLTAPGQEVSVVSTSTGPPYAGSLPATSAWSTPVTLLLWVVFCCCCVGVWCVVGARGT